MTKKFKQNTANMGIIVKNIPIEVHYSISMDEHYHKSLQQVYSIIIIKISSIKADLVLQMFFKAINNLVGFNRLILILLIFDVYFRITKINIPSLIITWRVLTMQKTINEIQKYIVSHQVNNVLNTQNRPSTRSMHNLSINSPVLVYREGNTG